MEKLIAFTQALIRQPSLSGQEAGAANLVLELLHALDYDECWSEPCGSVAGLRRGDLPGPRILFDAHLDVVPAANPQAWRCDPFAGQIQDGKIFGRGATDIKGGLAAALYALAGLPRSQLAGTLILSASTGEETMEGSGLRSLVERVQPDFVVIIEPTECRLAAAQKGRAEFWLQVEGRPAHTSRPELGDNAIYHAAEIIRKLRDLALPDDALLGKGIMELVEIISSPFPGECTVPYGCRLRYDRRLVAGETRATILDGIREILFEETRWSAGFQPVRMQTYTGLEQSGEQFYPAWALPGDSPWLAKAVLGLQAAGLESAITTAPFCTNGSLTAGEKCIPTLIYGPSSVALAHIVDEYIEIEELVRGYQGLAALARSLSGSPG